MKTYEIIFIISLLVLVVFLFVFIIVSINNYNKGGVKKYNLFSNFLYELNGFRRYNKLSYTYTDKEKLEWFEIINIAGETLEHQD